MTRPTNKRTPFKSLVKTKGLKVLTNPERYLKHGKNHYSNKYLRELKQRLQKRYLAAELKKIANKKYIYGK